MRNRILVSCVVLLTACPGPGGGNGKAPGVPSGLAASYSAPNVSLTWDAPSGATGYDVSRSSDGGSTFTLVASVPKTSFVDPGVPAGATLFYRVRATNADGTSGWSTPVSVTAGSPPGPDLTPPTDLTATAVGRSEVDLAWTDTATGEDGWVVERADGNGAFAETGRLAADSTGVRDLGVVAGQTYSYRVHAYAGTTDGATSNVVMVTVPGGTGSPPAAPSGLVATAVSTGEIDLTWTDGSTNETGFDLERSTQPTSGFTAFPLLGANVTSYADTTVAASTTYYYRVRANNGAGSSAYSAVVSATTPAAQGTPPAAPSALTVTAMSASEIDISWADNSTDETGFDLERSTQATSGFTTLRSLGANVTSFADTTVAASTTYYYRVRASNAAGSSAYTAVANATTPAAQGAPPPAPTGLTATTASTVSIDLVWTASTGAQGYDVERSQSATSGFTQIAQIVSTQFVDTGLTPGTTYYYRVNAFDANGTSPYTAVASAATASLNALPAAPTNLAAAAITDTSLLLTWTDNANNETSYNVSVSTARVTIPVSVPADSTSYTATGLTAGVTYTCSVQAVNAAGASATVQITYTMPSAQPTTQTTSLVPTYDNLMMMSTTDANLAGTVYSSSELDDGCNWVYGDPRSDFVCATSLLLFDTSAVSGKTVIQATLTLSTMIPPADWNSTLVVQACASSWNPNGVTWSTAPQVYLSPEADQPPPAGSNPVVFDVTPIVQYWASGARPNYGFLLENAVPDYADPLNSVLRMVGFYSLEQDGGDPSLRPTLTITYQ